MLYRFTSSSILRATSTYSTYWKNRLSDAQQLFHRGDGHTFRFSLNSLRLGKITNEIEGAGVGNSTRTLHNSLGSKADELRHSVRALYRQDHIKLTSTAQVVAQKTIQVKSAKER